MICFQNSSKQFLLILKQALSFWKSHFKQRCICPLKLFNLANIIKCHNRWCIETVGVIENWRRSGLLKLLDYKWTWSFLDSCDLHHHKYVVVYQELYKTFKTSSERTKRDIKHKISVKNRFQWLIKFHTSKQITCAWYIGQTYHVLL